MPNIRFYDAEGLPEGRDPIGYIKELLGIAPDVATRGLVKGGLGVDFRMRPTFEEKILEHKNGHYVCQDWKGNICEISDEYGLEYLRHAIDFVTRRWIKCPVENRELRGRGPRIQRQYPLGRGAFCLL